MSDRDDERERGRGLMLDAAPSHMASLRASFAQVAQLVEQGTENPRVGGSIPPLGIVFAALARRDPR